MLERPERCHHTNNGYASPQRPNAKTTAKKKSVRNEMRQATLIENLYKCLSVADAVEIYEMDRLCGVCVCRPSSSSTPARDAYGISHCTHPNLLPVASARSDAYHICCRRTAAMANDAKIFFFGDKFRDVENRKRNETNATDEKSNGFHQSFYQMIRAPLALDCSGGQIVRAK